jgi:hypothetical protein
VKVLRETLCNFFESADSLENKAGRFINHSKFELQEFEKIKYRKNFDKSDYYEEFEEFFSKWISRGAQKCRMGVALEVPGEIQWNTVTGIIII